MPGISTKQHLLSLIDDVDLISRELLDVLGGKDPTLNSVNLVKLLIEKDKEIKEVMKNVEHQVETQKKIDLLRGDIAKSDQQILSVQRHLREAELLLKTALYYSRQKLESMQTAAANPVEPEEVIRYGHKISASHGAVAPENWTQGDPRRPYPTDEEMRRGFLGHLDETGQFRDSVLEAITLANQTPMMPVLPPLSSALSSTPNTPPMPTNTVTGSSSTAPPATGGRLLPPRAGLPPPPPGAVASWNDFPSSTGGGGAGYPGASQSPANAPMPPPTQPPPPGTFATGSLLPPGVNVVSSPNLSAARSAPSAPNAASMTSSLAAMLSSTGPPQPPSGPAMSPGQFSLLRGGQPAASRGGAGGDGQGGRAAATMQHDVEVMSTDSSSSSSSED